MADLFNPDVCRLNGQNISTHQIISIKMRSSQIHVIPLSTGDVFIWFHLRPADFMAVLWYHLMSTSRAIVLHHELQMRTGKTSVHVVSPVVHCPLVPCVCLFACVCGPRSYLAQAPS